MQIAQDHVVAFHFTLTNADGDLIDSSRGQLPFIYLHGHDNLVSGLEQALEGHQKGDSLEVIVPPELGYGEPDPNLIQTLPRAMLPADAEITVGMTLQADTDDGQLPVRITAMDDDTITVDGNHHLAGETLHFSIEIRNVRPASAEEIAQGYPDP